MSKLSRIYLITVKLWKSWKLLGMRGILILPGNSTDSASRESASAISSVSFFAAKGSPWHPRQTKRKLKSELVCR